MIPKFRAWDSEAEHMFYSDKPEDDYLFEFVDGKLEGLAIRPPEQLNMTDPPEPWCESYPVEQSTGLTDKQGKEIDWWEGDIYDLNGPDTAYEIVFEDGCFYFKKISSGYKILCKDYVCFADDMPKVGSHAEGVG